MNKVFIGILARADQRHSVAEDAAAFFKLLLVDLAACIPLFQNIERRASGLQNDAAVARAKGYRASAREGRRPQ
jgi:hypothetical protein